MLSIPADPLSTVAHTFGAAQPSLSRQLGRDFVHDDAISTLSCMHRVSKAESTQDLLKRVSILTRMATTSFTSQSNNYSMP